MVPASFAPAAPLLAATPAVNPILKRVADNMPFSLAPPQKKKCLPPKKKCLPPKKKVSSKLRIRDSEDQAVLSQGSASPLEPTAPMAVMVDLTSSETHSDTPHAFKEDGCSDRPLQDPYAAMAQSLKHVTQAVNGLHILARWCDHLAQERAKEVVALTKELSSEKEASKANQALEQATKEKNEALELVASARVQFATQKIREFLGSPNYASKIHTEYAAYLYSLASDHKIRFSDFVTLFGEEKTDKPEWYGDLALSDNGSSDEEAAEGVEACSSDRNPVTDS
ncbi:hypothetical protein LIER_15610 [Lithospermum erythrorhizon]|uniref:Uncharacterized protein n=1 Tax=Lithospermum erythrorhizon TaxID=34254 RepID=A0AAV3Q3J2_LITER